MCLSLLTPESGVVADSCINDKFKNGQRHDSVQERFLFASCHLRTVSAPSVSLQSVDGNSVLSLLQHQTLFCLYLNYKFPQLIIFFQGVYSKISTSSPVRILSSYSLIIFSTAIYAISGIHFRIVHSP